MGSPASVSTVLILALAMHQVLEFDAATIKKTVPLATRDVAEAVTRQVIMIDGAERLPEE